MDKNVFKDAYLGKPYKMKNGNKAIFHRNANNKTWYLICEEIHDRIPYDSNGVCRGDNCFDIVSEWNESIEEEYEKKVKSLIDSCIYWEAYESEPKLFAESLKELLDFAPEDKRTIDYCSDLIKSRKTILDEVNNAVKSIIDSKSKEINEEELDKTVENIVDTFLISDYTYGNISYKQLKNLVKAGYRKAKSE